MPKNPHHRSASWTCVMVKDGPGLIDERVRTALEITAYKMHLDGWEATRFKVDTCEGYIENSGKTQSIAAITGLLYKAQVESDEGVYRINFLINARDLERGAERLKEIERGETGFGVAIEDDRAIPSPLLEFIKTIPRQLN